MPASKHNVRGGDPLKGCARYKTVRHLGEGTFGSVVLAEDITNGDLVAIKMQARGPTLTRSYAERELAIHQEMNHPHIVGFRQVFLTQSHLCTVLEYCDQGDLYTHLVAKRRLSEDEARWIFQQLLIGLDYLHRMDVANRDIKLENTLLSGDAERPLVKLCDFGYSKSGAMHSAPDSKVGTPAYMAPEVMTERRYDGKAADVWSCGVLLFSLLVGNYPFERKSDKELPPMLRQQTQMRRVLARDLLPFPKSMKPISAECMELLCAMLETDPAKRIGLEGIMAHPWFRNDLPPGAVDMNDKIMDRQHVLDPEEEEAYRTLSHKKLRKLLTEARELPSNSTSSSTSTGSKNTKKKVKQMSQHLRASDLYDRIIDILAMARA